RTPGWPGSGRTSPRGPVPSRSGSAGRRTAPTTGAGSAGTAPAAARLPAPWRSSGAGGPATPTATPPAGAPAWAAGGRGAAPGQRRHQEHRDQEAAYVGVGGEQGAGHGRDGGEEEAGDDARDPPPALHPTGHAAGAGSVRGAEVAPGDRLRSDGDRVEREGQE